MDVALSYDVDPTPNSWRTLLTIDDFPANDMVTQTNFSVVVLLPAQESPHAVLRLRYVSFNPLEVYPSNNTDAIFYNCADIQIVSQQGNHTAAPAANAPTATAQSPKAHATANATRAAQSSPQVAALSNPACTSPPRWVATAETNSSVGKVSHQIYYDATRQLVRWERTGNLWNSTENSIVLITNYSDLSAGPPEYVIYPLEKKCLTYGADAFYPWQYGAQSGMQWYRNYTQGPNTFIVWTNPTNSFFWEADSNCLPVAQIHANIPAGGSQFAAEFTIFRARIVDSFPDNIFQAPSYCTTPMVPHQSCRSAPPSA